MLRDRLRRALSKDLSGPEFGRSREAARDQVLAVAAEPYDAALKELDRLRIEFRDRVIERRSAVDTVRFSDDRISELEGEIGSLPQRLTEAQLAEDEDRVAELKTAHNRLRRDLELAEAEREKAASELETFPSELELASHYKERAERIAGLYGHTDAAFLYGAVRSLEMQKVSEVQAAARSLAREHSARGGAPSGLTLTFDRTRRVAADHADYVEIPDMEGA